MNPCSESLDVSSCTVQSLQALDAIHLPNCSLAMWERPPITFIDQELREITATAFPDIRTQVHPGDSLTELGQLINTQGYDAEQLFPAWLADMAMLTEQFFEHAQDRPVTARLETLEVTGCPRFHVDRSYLRLICTYRGPGTEWLDDAQVDRQAQAGDASNESIIRYGSPNRLPAFTVGLMKGSGYPGCSKAGLVHRSPEIGPSDPSRVLLCLDC